MDNGQAMTSAKETSRISACAYQTLSEPTINVLKRLIDQRAVVAGKYLIHPYEDGYAKDLRSMMHELDSDIKSLLNL